MNLANIIKKPLITEKAAVAQQQNNAHVFAVDKTASKIDIRRAVEKLFNVKVLSVRTLIMPRKWKRYGRSVGKTKPWKKAVVTLVAGQAIEAFEPK